MSGELSYEEVMGSGAPRAPRGIRNNNPGNIEDGGFARSQRGYKGGDGRFAVFDTPESGRGAHTALLGSYGRQGVNTVAGVVSKWAPPSENDTAAYIRFVSGRMGVDPNAPLDMSDPKVLAALADAQAAHENGGAAPMREMSYEDVVGKGSPSPTARPRSPQLPNLRPDDALGFQVGVMRPINRLGVRMEDAARAGLPAIQGPRPVNDRPIFPGLSARYRQDGTRGAHEAERRFEAGVATAAADGRRPGKLGVFAGNTALTAGIPAGPVLSGGLSGALLSEADTPLGVMRDAALSAGLGKLADFAIPALGKLASRALSGKATPDAIMAMARSKAAQDAVAAGKKLGKSEIEVEAARLAKAALYDAVDNSGFRFQAADVSRLVRDFQTEMGKTALSKEASDNAQNIVTYAKSLKNPSLSQMEKLRGDIYEALNKKGGDNSVIGSAFRSRIDGLIDGVDNGLVRQARAYNARFKKADYVYRASESADLAAERTYGGDYGRKLKDRIAPLVDPLKTQRNFRGATTDEAAALNKLARGTKAQKVATEIGAMTDPRRMGGKLLAGALGGMTGTAGVLTGGASLPLTLALQAGQVGTGLAATGTASRIARKNLDELIALITSGGSRRALAPQPTVAANRAMAAIGAVRKPVAVAAAPALAAASRERKERNAKRL